MDYIDRKHRPQPNKHHDEAAQKADSDQPQSRKHVMRSDLPANAGAALII
jgi:hypothetical protein